MPPLPHSLCAQHAQHDGNEGVIVQGLMDPVQFGGCLGTELELADNDKGGRPGSAHTYIHTSVGGLQMYLIMKHNSLSTSHLIHTSHPVLNLTPHTSSSTLHLVLHLHLVLNLTLHTSSFTSHLTPRPQPHTSSFTSHLTPRPQPYTSSSTSHLILNLSPHYSSFTSHLTPHPPPHTLYSMLLTLCLTCASTRSSIKMNLERGEYSDRELSGESKPPPTPDTRRWGELFPSSSSLMIRSKK